MRPMLLIPFLLVSGIALAEPDPAVKAPVDAGAVEKPAAPGDKPEAAGEGAMVDPQADVLATLELPQVAQALRESGVEEEEVDEALKVTKEAGMPASEASEVMKETKKSVDENGPVDNFGAFVQERLAEGLRGKDLAAAIKAEHQANGKGKGYGKDKGGKADHAGKPDMDGEGGKPDDAGKPDGKGGKPDDAGKPDGKGGKPDMTGKGGKPDMAGKGGKPDMTGKGGKPDGKGGKPAGAGGNR